VHLIEKQRLRAVFHYKVQAGAMFRQQEKPRGRVAEIRLPPQTNDL